MQKSWVSALGFVRVACFRSRCSHGQSTGICFGLSCPIVLGVQAFVYSTIRGIIEACSVLPVAGRCRQWFSGVVYN